MTPARRDWKLILIGVLALGFLAEGVVLLFGHRLPSSPAAVGGRVMVSDRGVDFFPADPEFLPWDAIAGFFGGVITLFSVGLVGVFYWRDSVAARRIACREIYQRLELASIELFRFEATHRELVSRVWDDDGGAIEELPAAERYAVGAYLFQVLNLFEMAVRFRHDGTMEPEVFGSWVVWMFELCSAKHFQSLWRGMRLNYVGALQRILSRGVELCRGPAGSPADLDVRRRAFFVAVAREFGDCPFILSAAQAGAHV